MTDTAPADVELAHDDDTMHWACCDSNTPECPPLSLCGAELDPTGYSPGRTVDCHPCHLASLRDRCPRYGICARSDAGRRHSAS